MAGGGCQDEPVPDGVLVGEALPHVEDDADRVDHGAGADQDEVVGRERLEHRVDRDDNRPAQSQVESDGKHFPSTREDDLHERADNGDRPDERQEARSPLATDPVEQQGCVGARNHQEDGCVIEAPQEFLGAGWRAKIVGRRARKHREQTKRIKAGAEDQQEMIGM